MSQVTSSRCQSLNCRGEPCGAVARPRREWCAFHDPECRKGQQAARRAGGKARSMPRACLPANVPALPLSDAKGVCGLLADTIHQVRTGQVDTKIASTVGYLASVLVRALEVGGLEDRLAVLEATVRGQSRECGSSFHRDPAPEPAGTGEGEKGVAS